MSVTVCKLDGNMSLYVILYALSLSKINLINVSPSKLSPILVQMSFACLCRYTFTDSELNDLGPNWPVYIPTGVGRVTWWSLADVVSG